jgi:hypothetical protein
LDRGGKIGAHHDLLDRGMLELKVEPVKALLQLNGREWTYFRKNVWGAVVGPMIREASMRRTLAAVSVEPLVSYALNTISETLADRQWFTGAPIGEISPPLSDPVAGSTLVAIEHLKAERRVSHSIFSA